ncbi:MAG: ribosomal protein S18-alanine N-acetyltransferase [Terriglobia bacterium]
MQTKNPQMISRSLHEQAHRIQESSDEQHLLTSLAPMNILIRSLDRKDVPEVLAIQQQNPSAAQWKESDYGLLAGQSGNLALVATEKSEPGSTRGFVVFRHLADQAELLNLAVAPPCQRQGIGRALIEEGSSRLAQAQVQRLFLEVRASNQQALRLYHSVGFERHSVRKGYYQNPGEDAYVLRLEIPIF